MDSQNGNDNTLSSWQEVLSIIPPSAIWRYALYFLIHELADRKWENNIYELQEEERNEQVKKIEFIQFARAYKQLEIVLIGIVLILLKIVLILFYYIGFIKKPIKQAIQTIENAIVESAKKVIEKEPKEKIERKKTLDEIFAEKKIKELESFLDNLKEKFSDNMKIQGYINCFQVSAVSIGQNWAEAELTCRKAEASADRAEAFWRGGFMVRAFGFGTIKLIRQLIVILALAMSIPFLIDFFIRQNPDYSVTSNLVQGLGFTAILWAITLATTLFLNDNRMKKIWKRAKLYSLESKLARANKFIFVSKDVKVAVAECLNPIMHDLEAEENFEILKILAKDSLAQIQAIITREEYNKKIIREEMLLISKKKSIKKLIQNFFDEASQGDTLDQVTDLM